MIKVLVEISGYVLLPLITWVIAHHLGYRLTIPSRNISTAAILIIISPIIEEIVFRGMLQELLFNVIPHTLVALLILNFGFAILHYRVNSNLFYLIAVFISGLIFSRLKVRFGSLWYSIGMHVYYNVVFWFANT